MQTVKEVLIGLRDLFRVATEDASDSNKVIAPSQKALSTERKKQNEQAFTQYQNTLNTLSDWEVFKKNISEAPLSWPLGKRNLSQAALLRGQALNFSFDPKQGQAGWDYNFFIKIVNKGIKTREPCDWLDVLRVFPDWLKENMTETMMLLSKRNAILNILELVRFFYIKFGKTAFLEWVQTTETTNPDFIKVCGEMLMFVSLKIEPLIPEEEDSDYMDHLELCQYLVDHHHYALSSTKTIDEFSVPFFLVFFTDCRQFLDYQTPTHTFQRIIKLLTFVLSQDIDLNYKFLGNNAAFHFMGNFLCNVLKIENLDAQILYSANAREFLTILFQRTANPCVNMLEHQNLELFLYRFQMTHSKYSFLNTVEPFRWMELLNTLDLYGRGLVHKNKRFNVELHQYPNKTHALKKFPDSATPEIRVVVFEKEKERIIYDLKKFAEFLHTADSVSDDEQLHRLALMWYFVNHAPDPNIIKEDVKEVLEKFKNRSYDEVLKLLSFKNPSDSSSTESTLNFPLTLCHLILSYDSGRHFYVPCQNPVQERFLPHFRLTQEKEREREEAVRKKALQERCPGLQEEEIWLRRQHEFLMSREERRFGLEEEVRARLDPARRR